MLPRVLVLAFCLSLVSCKSFVESYTRSSEGVSALDKKVLFDFRTNPVAQMRSFGADEQRQVFATIPLPSCPVPLGQPVPKVRRHIASVVDGSFTYAAEHETAYLVSGLPCGWSNRLMVFSGPKLQVSSDTAFAIIANTFDLNDDDKDELLLATETTKNGVLDREASLKGFDKNVLHSVEDFGIVYHNPCALFADADGVKRKELLASGRSPAIEAVMIYYLPRPGHQMPSFTVERYRAACSAPTQWQRVGIQ